jgi:hypothetical protein
MSLTDWVVAGAAKVNTGKSKQSKKQNRIGVMIPILLQLPPAWTVLLETEILLVLREVPETQYAVSI